MQVPRKTRSCRRLGARGWRTVLAVAALLAAQTAAAHDTWFEPHRDNGGWQLALGTGTRFPVQEYTLTMAQLQGSGCRAAAGAPLPLAFERDSDTALVLRAPVAADGSSCWAQSLPFELELNPDKIALYLNEIQAPPAVHEAWAALQARGLPWKERYTKHARIVLGAAGAAAASEAPMAMDVLLPGGAATFRVGDEVVFQVLRDGLPLAGQAVELHGERSPLGLWRRTDDQGRVSFRLPLAGRWVLRGTDLRLSRERPDTWDSRFVTLAFEVMPRAAESTPQNGKTLKLKTRSPSQTSEIAAIISEPPTNTPTR